MSLEQNLQQELRELKEIINDRPLRRGLAKIGLLLILTGLLIFLRPQSTSEVISGVYSIILLTNLCLFIYFCLEISVRPETELRKKRKEINQAFRLKESERIQAKRIEEIEVKRKKDEESDAFWRSIMEPIVDFVFYPPPIIKYAVAIFLAGALFAAGFKCEMGR